MPAKCLIQQWSQTDEPAVKRGMINDNTTLSHHFFEIAQTQGIGQVPSNTLNYNISGIMQAPEGCSDQ
jgi:hypothetical protein